MPSLSLVVPARLPWKAIAAAVIAAAVLPVCASPADAHGRNRDRDRDGLTDRYERSVTKTDPRRADTDGDGLKDGFEVRTCKTDPRRADTDGDGLSDRDEVRRFHTDPRKADTDGDGISDGAEVKAGTNPRDPRSPGTPPAGGGGTPPGDGTPPTGGGDPPGGGTTPPADKTPPETTVLTGPSGPRGVASATFTFSANETATFECRLDAGAFLPCTAPKTFSDLADGNHTLAVRAKDAAGNVDPTPASRAWSVDTTAPQTTITSGPPATTTDTTAQFTFSADEVATFQCRLDGGSWTTCSSPASLTGLALGQHTYEVRAVDGLLNTDATPAQRTWTVEAVAPDTTITAGPTGTVFEFSALLTFTSPDPTATFECRLNGSPWAACTSPMSYLNLFAGDQLFEVRAKSAGGAVDATPASRSWFVQDSGGGIS